ncbi:hypothetical protein ACRAWF_37190 [Streptomyces sp. L7]
MARGPATEQCGDTTARLRKPPRLREQADDQDRTTPMATEYGQGYGPHGTFDLDERRRHRLPTALRAPGGAQLARVRLRC